MNEAYHSAGDILKLVRATRPQLSQVLPVGEGDSAEKLDARVKAENIPDALVRVVVFSREHADDPIFERDR